jgi:hypothetical protein
MMKTQLLPLWVYYGREYLGMHAITRIGTLLSQNPILNPNGTFCYSSFLVQNSKQVEYDHQDLVDPTRSEKVGPVVIHLPSSGGQRRIYAMT